MALTDNILAYWKLDDDGSNGVSLLDSTGNGYTLTNNGGVTLGTGIIAGDAVYTTTGQALSYNSSNIGTAGNPISISLWVNSANLNGQSRIYDDSSGYGISISSTGSGATQGTLSIALNGDSGPGWYNTEVAIPTNQWVNIVVTIDGSNNVVAYIDGSSIYTTNIGSNNGGWLSGNPTLGNDCRPQYWTLSNLIGQLDEIGVWSRALSAQDVTNLYNSGYGLTYPFNQLYYNNAENDGDWGNLLNWWQDRLFTIQATALPDSTTPVELYGEVTQNTEGADQCFCVSANFWSANFGVGLTLQTSGVVNMQGTSLFAGTATDGVSMHDSSQLTATSVVDGNVTMRDSSRAFGSILGNATIYYDGGNGQYPIGGTVGGSVTYLGWPAVTPQWFNDQAAGGGNNGDFSDLNNWWSDDTYTTRPINSVGTQALPDASTDVFIAPASGITANSGTANPTINSVTANDSNIQNISITATNGFLFSGNEGVANAVLYGDVIFQDTAYNDHSVIQGKATYKSAASLQFSWGQNSLGNVNDGMYNGSTSFEVDISSGGAGKGGFISRLLRLPWFINI